MLKKMLEAPRFSGLRLRDYVYHVDPAAEKQFSAMTVVLPDETRYIAFRGTDDTLVAWKEDFNMGSLDAVPAQTDAASYLMRAAWRFNGGCASAATPRAATSPSTPPCTTPRSCRSA